MPLKNSGAMRPGCLGHGPRPEERVFMKLTLLCMGKTRERFIQEGIEKYSALPEALCRYRDQGAQRRKDPGSQAGSRDPEEGSRKDNQGCSPGRLC